MTQIDQEKTNYLLSWHILIESKCWSKDRHLDLTPLYKLQARGRDWKLEAVKRFPVLWPWYRSFEIKSMFLGPHVSKSYLSYTITCLSVSQRSRIDQLQIETYVKQRLQLLHRSWLTSRSGQPRKVLLVASPTPRMTPLDRAWPLLTWYWKMHDEDQADYTWWGFRTPSMDARDLKVGTGLCRWASWCPSGFATVLVSPVYVVL